MVLRMIVGLGLTAVAFAVAGRKRINEEASGEAKHSLEIITVAQLLVRAVKLREGAAQEAGT